MLTYLPTEEFEAKLMGRAKCAGIFFLPDEEVILVQFAWLLFYDRHSGWVTRRALYIKRLIDIYLTPRLRPLPLG